MAEQDQERNHAATPHKLKEARKRGQVAKSTDIVSAVVLAAAMTFLCWRGYAALQAQFRFDAALLARAATLDGSLAAMQTLLISSIRETLDVLGPFFAVLMLAAIVANVAQSGLVLSLHPIKPDVSRLHPARGFERLFSSKSLLDVGRALLKFVLVGWVVAGALSGLGARFFAIGAMSPGGFLHALLDSAAGVGLKIVLILFCVALLDLIQAKRQFARKMRMSPREIKEENRQREGDPRIRSRLRKLRQEMRKRSQGVRNTRHADVVITNPTHLAVALRYEHDTMSSPQVVAKGAGVLAAAMRHIAARNGIPIVQNPPLARQLYRQVDFDGHVPESLYADVARIIVWVFAMRQANEARAAARGAQA